MNSPDSNRRFPTTCWSIIAKLKSQDASVAAEAMREIYDTYRYPLYGYLRAGGLGHEDAEDLLHGFFEKMLRNDSIQTADSARGRLRTFLLTCLSRFKSNWQRGERQRRQIHLSAEAGREDFATRYEAEPRDNGQDNPEHAFDRRWAAELIARVRGRLRQRHLRRGKVALHDALAPWLDQEAPSAGLSSLAAALELSENALRISLHRLRKDFREILLKETARTLEPGQDPQDELRYLLSLFEE